MLTKTSIKKPFTVIVMIIVIAIIGGVAVFKMPLDLFPDMDLPYMIVATMVPGGAPEEVEGKVTNPLEENLRQINNVKNVTSISAENVSAVIMELQNGADLTTITQDIDTKIKAVRSGFPEMTMEPIIMKIDPDMMPIMTLAISKQGQKIEQSSDELEQITDKIRSVGGVASVSTTGQIESNVFIQVNPGRMLKDPSNLLANHLASYFDDKDTPVAVIEMLTKIDNMIKIIPGMKDVSILDEFNALKTSPADYFANLKKEGKGISLDSLLGDSSSEFLNMFNSMLTPELITMILTANSFEMPAGTSTVNGLDFMVKVGERVKTFDELKHLPTFSVDFREMEVLVVEEENENGEKVERLKILDEKSKLMLTPEERAKIKPLSTYVLDDIIGQYWMEDSTAGLTKLVDLIAEKIGSDKIPDKMKPTIVKTLTDLLYEKQGDGSYKRNNEIFEYITGIIKQPLTVQLSDVAYMYNTNDASKAHTVINGADGIMLSVYKTPDATVTDVTKNIESLLKDMHKNDSDINYIILSNQGEVTKFMISSIAQNLLLGALFAILVLLIFLRDWKPTVTVGMSIIVSLVTAFSVMYLCGVTLNLVSMGGLALSVGMLVDNSIVVIENIYRKRNEGVSPIKAAYDGTKQVSGAILSSTITTVIVFLPIIFVEGMARQIFMDLAITIAVSLFASLIIAITLVPMISSRMVHLSKASRQESKVFVKMKQGYAKALNFMLNRKWITIVVVLVLFVGSIIGAFFMDVEFMPNTQAEQIVVTVGVDKTKLSDDYAYDEIVDDLITEIDEEFDKKSYIKNKGIELSAGMTVMGFTMGGGNITSYITLDKKAKIKPKDAQKELYGIVEDIADQEKYNGAVVIGGVKNTSGVDVQGMVNSYLDASLLSINVYGEDIEKMAAAARELSREFAKIGEDVIVNDGLAVDQEQLKLVVDTNKASKYNLTTAQIFLQFFASSVPPTANSNINFVNDIGSNDIYIYTQANNMDRWYRVKDSEGKAHRMYFILGDDTDKATTFEERVEVVNGVRKTTIEYELDRDTATFTAKYRYHYDEDGKLIEAQTEDISSQNIKYTGNLDDMPVYYDNSKIYDFDMLTFMVNVPKFGEMPDAGAMPMSASEDRQVKEIPLFMLLSDKSFELDSSSKVAYRKVEDTTTVSRTYGDKYYAHDSDKILRYNYSGEDIATIKARGAANDLNPKVPQSVRKVEGFNTINHAEGRRVVQMGIKSASISNKQLEKEAKSIIKEFNEKYETAGIRVEFVGQNKMIAETFNSLFLMIGLAIAFIYLVMVAQFQSLKSPFIIMFTIPLALTGSILTLLMAGMPISVFALVGIILLVGIVVNNGIVFVDYVNKLMQTGMSKRDALLRTAQDRIRPILMTALTTICSMLISVFDTSMGASAIKPMAVTVVGGLTYATLLTLFFVPILYDLFNRKNKLAVIKFDDDKEDDIEAEMRLSNISSVKEVLEESKTLQMMDETFIANNMSTETPMETYINETTGENIYMPNGDNDATASDESSPDSSEPKAEDTTAEEPKVEADDETAEESKVEADVEAEPQEEPKAEDTTAEESKAEAEDATAEEPKAEAEAEPQEETKTDADDESQEDTKVDEITTEDSDK